MPLGPGQDLSPASPRVAEVPSPRCEFSSENDGVNSHRSSAKTAEGLTSQLARQQEGGNISTDVESRNGSPSRKGCGVAGGQTEAEGIRE